MLTLLTARPPDVAAQRQPLTLAGRLVFIRAADTIPVPDAWVVAHRVGPELQGPFDSLRSDARGRFRFTVARPDTLTVYLVSARYAGIGYFSAPYDRAAREGADAVVLAVYDTATTGPPLAIASRHVVLTAADEAGLRRVLDVIEIVNPTGATRIGRDTLAPVWRMRLPADINELEVGQSEIAGSAVRFEDGGVVVAAPMAPGEKQLALTYVLDRDADLFAIPVDQPIGTLTVMAEDSLTQPAELLRRGDPLVLEGRVFQTFVATNLAAGARPAVRLAPAGGTRSLWWIPVVAALALLVAGAAYAARARVAPR